MRVLLKRIGLGAMLGVIGGTAVGVVRAWGYVRASELLARGLPRLAVYEWNRLLFRAMLTGLVMGAVYGVFYHLFRRYLRRPETARAAVTSLLLLRLLTIATERATEASLLDWFLRRFQEHSRLDAALRLKAFIGENGELNLRAGIAVLLFMALIYIIGTTLGARLLRPLFRRFLPQGLAGRGWRRCGVIAGIATALVLAASLGVQLALPAAAVSGIDQVVLISLDTLGADYVGAYGAIGANTPELDRFMKQSYVFRDCVVSEPFTLTSHMSMHSSLYPGTQDVRITKGLDLDRLTVAELLRDRGLMTGGFAASAWLDPVFGFEQGFAYYYCRNEAPAEEINGKVFDWLRLFHNRPVFLFIHYYDIHSDTARLPYDAPEPFLNLFLGRSDAESFDGCVGEDCASWLLLKIVRGDIRPDATTTRGIHATYEAGVAATDRRLGRLLRELRRRGVWDRAAIVLTADHGEEMLQHGRALHEQLYRETIKAPLAIHLPGQQRGRILDQLAAGVDIPPTILSLVGIGIPREFQGHDLTPAMRGEPAAPRPLFATASIFPDEYLVPRHSVEDGDYKLILHEDERVWEEWYDLRRDPGETRPAEPEAIPSAARLRSELRDWLTANNLARDLRPAVDEEETSPLDPLTLERLQQLGYVR